MTSDPSPSPERIEEIFHEARELSGDARRDFLESRCDGDTELFDRVRSLLAALDDPTGDVLWKEPAIMLEARSSLDQQSNARMDRYKLLEPIGSGGMGVVYKAVRNDDAFSKLVAVKIVHAAAANGDAFVRFLRERQILAGLEHPNIARLLDGGATAEGLPFLAMEFIEGVPLNVYIAERKPSIADRLRMFRKICDAVSCAHRSLIVHRDLKPANILVTPDGEPKLLDFGVAKLLDGTAEPTRTVAAMTPEYASPEQLAGSVVTTATDVYSLGVVLFEMLTGSRPRGSQTRGALDADLENIVQMAMRPEPPRRYASVDQFAEDVRRYQEGYPVIARPDKRLYRVRKFTARNKLPVAGALLLIAAIAIGGISTWRQERIANRRFDDVRKLANSYLFEFHDAIKDLPGATPAKQLVVRRALEFLDQLSRERGSDSGLSRELADAYDKIGDIQGETAVASLGDRKGALASYQKALAIRESLIAAAPSNLAVARELGGSYAKVGSMQTYMGDVKSGIETARKGVARMEPIAAGHPRDDEAQETLALLYTSLADTLGNSNYQNLGDTKSAIDLYRKNLAIRETLVKAHPADADRLFLLATSYSRLAQLLQAQDDKPGAVGAYRRASELAHQTLDRNSGNARYLRDAAVSDRNLSMSLLRVNADSEAAAFGDRAHELLEKISAADPKNVEARIELADGTYSQGYVRAKSNPAEARRYYAAALAIYQEVCAAHPADPPPPGMRTTYQLLADNAISSGDSAAAITNAQHEIAIDERLLKLNPSNASAERNQALASRQIAKAHEIEGTHAALAATKRVAELREAKTWYQRSLTIYRSQQAKGTLIAMYASDLTAIPQAIERCDRALADLTSHK